MKHIDEAFTFVFKDPNWPTKLLIGGVFAFLSIVFVGLPVILGYGIELLQRVRRGEEYPLPEWTDVGVKFIVGFKYFITLVVYYLPVAFVMVPVMIYFVVASMNGISGRDLGAPLGAAWMFVMPYLIAVSLCTPFIAAEFATHERIRDGLNVARVFKSFKHFWEDAVILAIISFGLTLAAYLGILMFLIGIFLTMFFAICVHFHLYGQIGKAVNELSDAQG